MVKGERGGDESDNEWIGWKCVDAVEVEKKWGLNVDKDVNVSVIVNIMWYVNVNENVNVKMKLNANVTVYFKLEV